MTYVESKELARRVSIYCNGRAGDIDTCSLSRILLESYSSEWLPPSVSEQDTTCRKKMQFYISKYRQNKNEFSATGTNAKLK